jgi:hypothetical protein
MNVRKATIVRFILLVIGIVGAVTGLAFGFSSGQINLIPIPDLTYANPLSGIVIGTISILLALAETGELYHQYQRTKGKIDTQEVNRVTPKN